MLKKILVGLAAIGFLFLSGFFIGRWYEERSYWFHHPDWRSGNFQSSIMDMRGWNKYWIFTVENLENLLVQEVWSLKLKNKQELSYDFRVFTGIDLATKKPTIGIMVAGEWIEFITVERLNEEIERVNRQLPVPLTDYGVLRKIFRDNIAPRIYNALLIASEKRSKQVPQ